MLIFLCASEIFNLKPINFFIKKNLRKLFKMLQIKKNRLRTRTINSKAGQVVLHSNDLGQISGILYVSLSTTRSNFECRVKSKCLISQGMDQKHSSQQRKKLKIEYIGCLTPCFQVGREESKIIGHSYKYKKQNYLVQISLSHYSTLIFF